MNKDISKTGTRFPIQGNCWKTAENCNIQFCGLSGRHQSSGTIPWELARSAFLQWQSNNNKVDEGGLSVEDALMRIADRGGFGHDFMNTYFGSRVWFEQFAERSVSEIVRAPNVQKVNRAAF
jgi:hypothetical protein